MEKVWKITNSGKKEKIKFTVALASNQSPGVFLEMDEFVLSQPRMTTMLDAQEKRGYVIIDRNYVNSNNHPIGVALKMTESEIAKRKVADYKG
jgi:hypothetical protein